jgi:cysteine desulfurase / selenocysteine lyase
MPHPPRNFDIQRVRADFPLLSGSMQGKPLVYLDNAATSQKPRVVLETLRLYYESLNANVHRGVYRLSQDATDAHEKARAQVAAFLNAPDPSEIIFTRGATESINLVAHCWGRSILKPGDEVIVSHMEHHSNIVPWQIVCQATGARLRVIPINDDGELDAAEFANMLSGRTKIVSLVHISNSLGTINPIRQLMFLARQTGAVTVVDGAQSVPHLPIDVRDLGCDFFAFSGHKLYGPTGIGVLYGNPEILDAMPPYQGGGDMISSVSFEHTTWNELPYKFEAGTPNIAGAIGLGSAIAYLRSFNFSDIMAHEEQLLRYATEQVRQIPGVRIIGNARAKAGVISFLVDGTSPQDVGLRLDMQGIAVRTGHHCCQPLMDRFGISGTARVSLAMYNTKEDIDVFVRELAKIAEAARGRKSVPVCPQAEPTYPEPAGQSPEAVADEIRETFEFLEDWPQRYQYLIEMGEKLLPMPMALKTEENRVRGCQSTVFVAARRKPGADGTMEFLADSDADIVRGLVALLQKLFSGHRAADILAFDVEEYFARLGLEMHLSMTRRNGLHGMVQRIRTMAAEVEAGRLAAVVPDCESCTTKCPNPHPTPPVPSRA